MPVNSAPIGKNGDSSPGDGGIDAKEATRSFSIAIAE